jgi:hypothetical protein
MNLKRLIEFENPDERRPIWCAVRKRTDPGFKIDRDILLKYVCVRHARVLPCRR